MIWGTSKNWSKSGPVDLLTITNMFQKIRHCAAKHQWSVIMPGLGCQPGILDSFKGPQGEVPGLVGIGRMTFLQVCFCCVFLYPFFLTLTPTSIPKWSPTRPNIDEKMMLVAILKKVSVNLPKIFDFSLIFQKADALKTE